MEIDCRHGLAVGTCSICKAESVGSTRRSPKGSPLRRSGSESRSARSRRWWPSGAKHSNHQPRYNARPETFKAYEDVWKNVRGAKSFKGGWTAFSRAANAEPAMPRRKVRKAERLMMKGGYVSDEKAPNVGRRWHVADSPKKGSRRRTTKSRLISKLTGRSSKKK